MTEKIINTYDQLLAARKHGLPDVAIRPRYLNGGRSTWRDGWKVYRPNYNIGTEKNPFDLDYGCKVFADPRGPWKESRARSLQAAKDWTAARYKIQSFSRNRMGDYVSSDANKKFPLPKKSGGIA
jgi:hypothetical protein